MSGATPHSIRLAPTGRSVDASVAIAAASPLTAAIDAFLADPKFFGVDFGIGANNANTLRSCALGEIVTSMSSIQPDGAIYVITKENQNIEETACAR